MQTRWMLWLEQGNSSAARGRAARLLRDGKHIESSEPPATFGQFP